MRIAFVGCGYAADFYAATLKNHPQLELVGCFDINEERSTNFSHMYSVHKYQSLNDILEDSSIAIVVNLTNAREHFRITEACLVAGKHVYSEKPLATNLTEATILLELANEKSLQIACAPAILLGEAAQTVWKLLRNEAIGKVWLTYAELDDGAIHQMNYRDWPSHSGIAWPFQDEFEVGCTLEHAAYHLGWLTAFFGPATKVVSFSSCLVPNKFEENTSILGDDLSVACITFSSGVVARLTCSTLAPKNHSLTIIGSEGVLTVEDCWHFQSPVYIQARLRHPSGHIYLSEKQEVSLERLGEKGIGYEDSNHDIDFACGIAELAEAIQNQRAVRISAQHAVHITEILSSITSAISYHDLKTSFPPIIPIL